MVFTLTQASTAGAYRRDRTDVEAGSLEDGVEVVWANRVESGAERSSGGCDWHAEPYLPVDAPYGYIPPSESDPNPGPDERPYLVWCGDESPRLVWLGPQDVGPAADAFAGELVRRLTVAPATVDVRPAGRGITGVPSLFWVEGYGAAPLQLTESAFGLTVSVTVALVGVEWDFGDGSPVVTAGLGEAWPERSSVRHTYRDASPATPYQVTARLLFQPTYTVNGAPGAPLGRIVVPTSRPYVVRQVQSVRRA